MNVYPQHNNTRNAIKWSASLDQSFRRNLLTEPSLSFQFFCSIDGFMRIFPLIKWRVPKLFSSSSKYERLYGSSIHQSVTRHLGTVFNSPERKKNRKIRPEVQNLRMTDGATTDSGSEGEEDNVDPEMQISDDELEENDPSRALDLYDCRMRDWFIKAAAPPKDIIVLADSSGSMRGERSKIAQNVIINVLETLTENDFVSVLRFNTQVFPVHSCFGTRFVQADKRNVARFKDEILEMSDDGRLEEAEKAANFTEAFQYAFKLFEKEKREMFGESC